MLGNGLMLEEHHVIIKQMIEERGPLGVNTIANELGVPLTTMQKRLHKQDYFVLNDRRKWDLPGNVAEKSIEDVDNNFDALIDAQITGIDNLVQMLSTNLKTTVTLLKTQKPQKYTKAPVAANVYIHPDYKVIVDEMKTLEGIVKKYRDRFDDDTLTLLLNTDWVRLRFKLGLNSFMDEIGNAFGDFLSPNGGELSETVIKHVKENQK